MKYQLLGNEDQSPSSTPHDPFRDVYRTAARVGETALGLPADVANAATSALDYVTNKVVPEEKRRNILPKLPLGSEWIRENVTKKLSGDFLEPQSENEEWADELAQDLTSFMFPVKGKIPFKNAILSTIGGQIGKQAAKFLGGEESAQALGKVGGIVASGLLGVRPSLGKLENEAYAMTNRLAEGVSHDASSLEKQAEKLKHIASIESDKNLKGKIEGVVESIENAIAKNKPAPLEPSHLVDQFGKAINTNKVTSSPKIDLADQLHIEKSLNALNQKKIPGHIKSVIKNTKDVNNASIKDYASKNPEFNKWYDMAKDLHIGLNTSSKVGEFLNKVISPKTLEGKFTGFLLGHAALQHPTAALATGAVGLGARETVKAIDLLMNSKQAQKHYINAINESFKGSAKGANREIRALDKSMIESENEQSNKYQLLD